MPRRPDVLTYFPYTPRPYQEEVIGKIRANLNFRHVCLHAPTGFGKTVVILSTLFPRILRGLRVIWAVRTGNETDRPIDELKMMVNKLGLPIFGISYRGKRDMCLLAESYGGDLDYSDVSYMCSSYKDKCMFYRNFKRKFRPQSYLAHGPLTYSEVYSIGRQLKACPYYIQRALAKYASVISLSYNYVVDQRLEWSIRPLIPFGKSILVVDEAHNLQSLELNSDTITLGTIRRAIREAEEFKAKDLVSMLHHAEDKALEIHSKLKDEEDASFNPEDLIPHGSYYLLEDAVHIGELVRRSRLERGLRPRSSLHHFAEFMLSALSLEGIDGISFIAERDGDNLKLNIWDMRASEILADRWLLFHRCIFCSGTLEPIDAFAETVGLGNYVKIKVPNIYHEENVKVYILTGVTTRGEELSDEMADRYVNAISIFLQKVKVNSAIFTASYRVQSKLLNRGLKEKVEGIGYKMFIERRGMSGPESRSTLMKFKELGKSELSVLVAPIGGRFAEGADFPGEELEAIFLVGIPFEKPTTRTKLYIDYYKSLYGEDKGKLYAYILPALRRASQALGRAIRSIDDKAVLVLADDRYLGYLELLPDYVKEWYTKLHYSKISEIESPWM